MFGKWKDEQRQAYQRYLAEERRLRIELARAIAEEGLTGERKESALKRIAEYESEQVNEQIDDLLCPVKRITAMRISNRSV